MTSLKQRSKKLLSLSEENYNRAAELKMTASYQRRSSYNWSFSDEI